MGPRPVIVIGGGFAGMAAATRLAEQGVPVILLEKRTFLGGRAVSVPHRESGDYIDNGQHLLMGCYHETIAFLRRIGTSSTVRFQDSLEITYRGPHGFYDRLACPHWPGPFHLAAGLWRARSFGLRDLWAAGRLKRAFHHLEELETVAALCHRRRQTEKLERLLWNPITLSALNAAPETADAHLFAEVIRRAFLASASDSRLGFPLFGLQPMHDEYAMLYLLHKRQSVRCNACVERLEWSENRVTAVILLGGERLPCSAVISAVPEPALQKILARSPLPGGFSIPSLGSSAILSVYLWYDKSFSRETITCLDGVRFEWIFHRSNFMENAHRLHCLCLVISAANRFFHWPRETLIAAAIHEVQSVYPDAAAVTPRHAHVFWERHATFACTPENARLRPGLRTPIANLFLAGDWTDTGLPATIEGAVLSGHRSAEAVLQG